jgi:hypothetical protein
MVSAPKSADTKTFSRFARVRIDPRGFVFIACPSPGISLFSCVPTRVNRLRCSFKDRHPQRHTV